MIDKNNRILYLEGSSGISGDMAVSALLDLGASRKKLEDELGKLPVKGYRLVIGRTKKCGIDACAFYVEPNDEELQPYRNYRQIQALILESGLEQAAKDLALHIFHILAEAEAKVHGTSVEDVHFHEVGAVDSIVDIVAAAVCLTDLGIREAAVGTLAEGAGTVNCQHGQIPVPVPATAELIREYGLPVRITLVEGEMITPTGAAIAAAVRTRELPRRFQVERIGIGSGVKDFPHANILRAMILQDLSQDDTVQVMETNVDDCTGEQLGYTQELLLEAGALDVVFRPIYMKKSRPAYLLQVICRPEQTEELQNVIFRETTTIGIRSYMAKRTVLERRIRQIDTPYGPVRVKICRFGVEEFHYPEYEDVKDFCRASGESYRNAYEMICKQAEDVL